VIQREREAALSLLAKFIAHGAFVESAVDTDGSLEAARVLSEKHTERLGCRGFDLLHVAQAIELECEGFLTSDRVQAALARAEGLEVTISAEE
jgi:predicted nucleic acid-binding protein